MRVKSARKRECPKRKVLRDRNAGRSKGGMKETGAPEVLYILEI